MKRLLLSFGVTLLTMLILTAFCALMIVTLEAFELLGFGPFCGTFVYLSIWVFATTWFAYAWIIE